MESARKQCPSTKHIGGHDLPRRCLLYDAHEGGCEFEAEPMRTVVEYTYDNERTPLRPGLKQTTVTDEVEIAALKQDPANGGPDDQSDYPALPKRVIPANPRAK